MSRLSKHIYILAFAELFLFSVSSGVVMQGDTASVTPGGSAT